MDPRIKCILIENLASEWKRFALDANFSKAVIDYVDLDKHCDQLKMDKLLGKLVLQNPSDFLLVVENSLTLMGKTDILNEIKMLGK